MFNKFKLFLLLIVFLISLFLLGLSVVLSPKVLDVKQVSPLPNSKNVSLYPNINLVFSRPLQKQEAQKLFISISPQIDYDSYFSSDNSSLTLIVKKSLALDQKYTIKLSLLDKSFTWEFTTVSSQKASQDELIRKQGEADLLYAQSEKEFLDKYPWYPNLPEPNDEYFIGFDSQNNEFFVDIYVQKSSSENQDLQAERTKQKVLVKLEEIGVDIDKYKIVWGIYPQ